MSKFSEYIQSEHDKPAKQDAQKIKENNVQDMLDYYGQMDSTQLMAEFLKASKKKKEQGGLDDEECEKLTNALSPYLNAEQKETMLRLLERSKNV